MNQGDLGVIIQNNFYSHQRDIEATLSNCYQDIVKAASLIVHAYKEDKKVLIFGNGGSAGDAQHIVGELMNQYMIKERPPLAAIALTANSSVITAIGKIGRAHV